MDFKFNKFNYFKGYEEDDEPDLSNFGFNHICRHGGPDAPERGMDDGPTTSTASTARVSDPPTASAPAPDNKKAKEAPKESDETASEAKDGEGEGEKKSQ
ncbi:hypothetical protein CAEBREN_04917 [Caenorhabditis brenneri]|uniref:Uncharacterized protein n=1 Tax=Caenorhabditis brenneri TaxID=135651 RepID=G0M7R7_CAEBE|nr:hypothetical protein CAEBREN_04917 [Caenorhabditis brenneri]